VAAARGQAAATRRPWRSRPTPSGVAVGALVVLVAGLYSAFALFRFYTFQTSSYDLVIFDEAIRSYAHFQPGISIIKGLHNGFGPNFSVLGDHWSPILASLAPLYWLHGGPQALLVAQAVLFALAIPPLWLFTRRALGGGRRATAAAYLVSVAYALSWTIAAALAFDFHEVAFAPVLTAVALERLQARRVGQALLALAALLLVKEDMGLLVAGIGCYLAVSRRYLPRQGLLALALIAGGLADTAIATYILIPAFGGRSDYYWAYDALGRNMPQLIQHLVTHPLGSLRELITPRVKLDTMLWLFGAFCFLPLLSPITIAAVPLLLERMLASTFQNWWGTSFHYNAYLVIILLCGAVDGSVRLGHWIQQAREYWARHSSRPRAAGQPSRLAGNIAFGSAEVMCALAILLVPRFAFAPALHPAFYHRTPKMQAQAAAVAEIPAGVTVEATNNTGPQLSGRDTVLLWDGDGATPPLAASWVLANVSQPTSTFNNIGEQRERVMFLRRNGYKIVFQRDGYLVLHRGG
jgi:uncharacterized membrane protein